MADSIDKWRQVRLKVWGEYALFTRPENKVERLSYDIMTPSAARGVLEAILWKPAIRWLVRRIDLLRPIRFGRVDQNDDNWDRLQEDQRSVRFTSIRRNEVGCAMSHRNKTGFFVEEQRQQRAGMILRDVAYVIHAEFELTEAAGSDDTIQKFSEMFRRRAAKGQCFHRPYLGCREFGANFELIDFDQDQPEPVSESRDLGWMFYDYDYAVARQAMFFQARLDNGSMIVPPYEQVEVRV